MGLSSALFRSSSVRLLRNLLSLNVSLARAQTTGNSTYFKTTAEAALFDPAKLPEAKMSDENSANNKIPPAQGALLERGSRFLVDEWRRMNDCQNPPEKIINFLHPEELKQKLNLRLSDERGDSHDELLQLCRTVAHYSLQGSHVHNYNQMWHGVDEAGLLGAWFADTFNTQAFTYEVAPAFTLIENFLLNYIGTKLVGYNEVDGTMCPGGSMANMYAMSLARHRARPQIKLEGMMAHSTATNEKNDKGALVAFTSRESHYSTRKGMAFMGFGENNLVIIDCDERGRMRSDALEEAIQKCMAEGNTPFYVNATSGSTVLGAFDPLDALADICERYNKIWLHCDGAWGGAALLVPELRQKLLHGIERCDSVLWNPHKMLCLPLQCSVFLTRHCGLLASAHSGGATYLFQTDKFYDTSYDTGDRVIQCGRHVDAFKLYLKWRALGLGGLREEIQRAFAQAKILANLIEKHDNFELVMPYSEEQCTNVGFWYVPPALRGEWNLSKGKGAVRKALDDERRRNGESGGMGPFESKLHAIAPKLKQTMTMQGTLMIGYQPSSVLKLPNFFRMLVHAVPHQTQTDMEFVVNELDRLGREMKF